MINPLNAISPFIIESMFFLARYFSIVPCGPLSMRVWWPFQKNRPCIPFFGSGYAGLGLTMCQKALVQGFGKSLDAIRPCDESNLKMVFTRTDPDCWTEGGQADF